MPQIRIRDSERDFERYGTVYRGDDCLCNGDREAEYCRESNYAMKEPSSPNLMKNLMMGGLLGMILAIAVIVVRFLMDDTIKTEEDVKKYLGLNTLASLPVEKGLKRKGKGSIMKHDSRKIVGIILLVLAVICAGCFAYYKVSQSSKENVYAKVQREHVDEGKKEGAGLNYICPIDFEELQEMNPDIYAWIEIPGTQINYPIVQSAGDDDYYLNHTIEGEEGYPGSIYTESLNAKGFS